MVGPGSNCDAAATACSIAFSAKICVGVGGDVRRVGSCGDVSRINESLWTSLVPCSRIDDHPSPSKLLAYRRYATAVSVKLHSQHEHFKSRVNENSGCRMSVWLRSPVSRNRHQNVVCCATREIVERVPPYLSRYLKRHGPRRVG